MGMEEYFRLIHHYANGGEVHPAHTEWLKEMFSTQHYAQGGMVNATNAFNPKNGILKGGLNLVNPKNKVSGILDIQYNQNNIIAKANARK